MLFAVEVALLLFSLAAVFMDKTEKRRFARRAGPGGLGVTATVTRGLTSMKMFAGVFTAAVTAVGLLVVVSEVGAGYKVAMILLDYAVLMYLFFLNSWFRNKLIGLYIRLTHEP